MNRKLLYGLIAFAITGLTICAVSVFLSLRHVASTGALGNPFGFPNGQMSTTTVTSTSTGETRTITTKSGVVINVPNFTKDKSSQQIGNTNSDVQYDLTPYPDYVAGQPYPDHKFDVSFNQQTSQFIITLNDEPIGGSRKEAESFLRTTLQLSNQQLCALNVVVGVPYALNPQYSAQNLGLSFCPGAVPLP